MVAPRFRGRPFENADTWRALKPASGNNWGTNYYSTTDNVLNSHASSDSFTVGVVHLVRTWNIPSANRRGSEQYRQLLRTGTTSNGYALGQRVGDQGVSPNQQSAGAFLARVGNPPFKEWSNNLRDEHAGAHAGAPEASGYNQEGIQITAFVVDADTYPDDGFYVNSVYQDRGVGSGQVNWTRSSPGSGATLYLGRGPDSSTQEYTDDWIIGWFFVEDAMSQEELSILQHNIMLARRIPDVDVIGGGVVPDYIFDVKSQMEMGTATAPSTWTSIGSAGSPKTMSKTGNLDVVEVASDILSGP